MNVKTSYLCGIVVALSLVNVGCITVEPVRLSENLQAAALEESGLVLGSIGVPIEVWKRTELSRASLIFRSKDRVFDGRISFGAQGNTPLQISDDRFKGTTFAMSLAPGEYEVYQIDFFYNRGQFGTDYFYAEEDFSMSFVVHKDESIYIGEYLAIPVHGKNFLGMPIPGGGFFVISDQRDRDFKALQASQPELIVEDILAAIPDPKTARSPAIRSELSEPTKWFNRKIWYAQPYYAAANGSDDQVTRIDD